MVTKIKFELLLYEKKKEFLVHVGQIYRQFMFLYLQVSGNTTKNENTFWNYVTFKSGLDFIMNMDHSLNGNI